MRKQIQDALRGQNVTFTVRPGSESPPPEETPAHSEPPDKEHSDDAVLRRVRQFNLVPKDIRDHYSRNQHRFRSKLRVAFDYLFADAKEFASLVDKPAEAEIKAYYEANKDEQFAIPPEDPAAKPTYRLFEDCKEEIVEKLVFPKAMTLAQDAFQKVFTQIAVATADPKKANDEIISRMSDPETLKTQPNPFRDYAYPQLERIGLITDRTRSKYQEVGLVGEA